MEAARARRHHQRPRSARAPPPPPPPLSPHPRHLHHAAPPGQNPSRFHRFGPGPAADDMEDDAITTLMDIDDSPRSSGAGATFLDDDDDAEVFAGHRLARATENRGPLPFAGFFNNFDGADFDDSDLA